MNRKHLPKRIISLVSVMALIFSNYTLSYAQVGLTSATYKIEDLGSATTSSYKIRTTSNGIIVREYPYESAQPIATLASKSSYEVVDRNYEGWVGISTGDTVGYVKLDENVTEYESVERNEDTTKQLREDIVKYALSFVGGRYVFGGSDPHSGVDCSGFTSYIMKHVAGITLSHSSSAQSHAGHKISAESLKPGDLVFYGGKGYINHVAIYIGDDLIVHAASSKSGIKISDINHRNPVCMVDVIG